MHIVQSGDPVGEVVSLDLLKQHLRVDHSDDDFNLTQALDAAIEWVRDVCGTVFLETEFTATGEDFCLSFKGYPDPDILSVTYVDPDGQTGTTTSYSVQRDWLVVENAPAIRSATVVFTAGLGERNIPEKLKRAILQLAEVFYDKSGDGIPESVRAMVAHHRSFAY